jgi:GT2 family glycosyltransferase
VISVVIPNWNGRRWLPGCLAALEAQELEADEVIVVDNGSRDGSLEYLREEHPDVQVISLSDNTGFAHAANVGLQVAPGDAVALVNADVELAPDWLARTAAALEAHPRTASVACKMLSLRHPGIVDDAGDVLRRDGVCEQRGRFGRDDGRWDAPGDVFGACAGAALYRRSAVLGAGGFHEPYFAYLEDVDLALRLRMAGWTCRYEPVVALHAAQGTSSALPGGAARLATRNTLVLVARFWPARWLPYVLYRQLGWVWHAARERRLRAHLRALAAAVPMLPAALRARRGLRAGAVVPIGVAVPPRPWRGSAAGGHVKGGDRGGP